MENHDAIASINRFESRLSLGAIYRRYWRDYPVPANLKLTWSFGVLVAVALGVLTLSGIWLGVYYVPTARGAGLSIAEFSRDIPFGWLIHDLHRDGTTMLFGVVYIELLRGISYGSYRNRRERAWIIEVVRFFMFLATGFCGFVMTGGADADWSAMIMARHLAAIPLFGPAIAHVFLGGLVTGTVALPRVTMAHEAMGFLVLLVAALGFAASRAAPPANPDGIVSLAPDNLVPQFPAYAGKVLTALILFGLIFAAIIAVAPGLGQPPGNEIIGVPTVMPLNVTPPWFLLGFHGLVRAGQSLGVAAWFTIAASFALLGALPWLDRGTVASRRYRPLYGGFVWILQIDWIVLSIAAAKPATGAWPAVTDITAAYFFVHFLILTPLITLLEPTHPVPLRITQRTV
jgi:quinol-cytochrome oxidoreductase complex cytochrome b subunit